MGEIRPRELSGKDGYVKAEGDLKTFELGGPSFDAGTVVNERIDGTVSVKKVDETGDALAGATFGLFPVDASGVAASVPVMSATSGSDGIATFTNVHWAYIGSRRLLHLKATRSLTPRRSSRLTPST